MACRLVATHVRTQLRRHLATVAVGISGGVDSAVAALLLKQHGHEVIGVHMTNWDGNEEGSAQCVEKERIDAERVCHTLKIGFHEVSFVREYWTLVFEPFLQAYRDGNTPNPDVACNQRIKFDHFLKHVMSLGADCVATGHYARLDQTHADGRVQLLTAVDGSKDQTYFLSCTQQQALQQVRPPKVMHAGLAQHLCGEKSDHTFTDGARSHARNRRLQMIQLVADSLPSRAIAQVSGASAGRA